MQPQALLSQEATTTITRQARKRPARPSSTHTAAPAHLLARRLLLLLPAACAAVQRLLQLLLQLLRARLAVRAALPPAVRPAGLQVLGRARCRQHGLHLGLHGRRGLLAAARHDIMHDLRARAAAAVWVWAHTAATASLLPHDTTLCTTCAHARARQCASVSQGTYFNAGLGTLAQDVRRHGIAHSLHAGVGAGADASVQVRAPVRVRAGQCRCRRASDWRPSCKGGYTMTCTPALTHTRTCGSRNIISGRSNFSTPCSARKTGRPGPLVLRIMFLSHTCGQRHQKTRDQTLVCS